MPRLFLSLNSLLLVFVVTLVLVDGSPRRLGTLEAAEPLLTDRQLTTEVKPLLAKYCFACHSEKRAEGDIDLTSFNTLAELRKATRVWQKVAEMIDGGQMPPKQAKQPTDAERQTLRTWLTAFLKAEAKAHAGDPGRVTVRRLSNTEYTYTIHDLTGISTLEPTKEFPIDGAAGEGFTNAGDALVMSPTLVTKYLDAAKDIAGHAVLLPDGIRFSASKSRRDWTNEALAAIRAMYAKYTVAGTARKMNLQGVVFDEREGGRLPLEKYFIATIKERQALEKGTKTFAAVADEYGLSAVYLQQLWQALIADDPSRLLGSIRNWWRAATPERAEATTQSIMETYGRFQSSLWKTNTVGHIGRLNGPKSWMEPVDPTTTKLDLRYRLPANPDLVLCLNVSSMGEGKNQADVIWHQPKFVAAGQPEILLRDLRAISEHLIDMRTHALAATTRYLQAVDEASTSKDTLDHVALAKKHNVNADVLRNWLAYLGVSVAGPIKVEGHFKNKMADGTYKFISGWGSGQTPLVIANSSDQHVRVPGNMKPHSVAVHPSPTLNAIVGWQSPVEGKVRVLPKVQHAHPECGNGVTWSLELRHGATRQRLANGIAQGGREIKIDPVETTIKQGALLSLVVGPRDGNHSCDLTEIDLTITAGDKSWNLAKDVSGNIQDANPHADSLGNKDVWHFYTEAVTTASHAGFTVPVGSVLDQWRNAKGEERRRLAEDVQKVLLAPLSEQNPNRQLQQQLTALSGPLFGSLRQAKDNTSPANKATFGLDASLFGKHPTTNMPLDPASLCMAKDTIDIRIPPDLLTGYEFVTSATLTPDTRRAVQIEVSQVQRARENALSPGEPILVAPGAAQKQLAAEFKTFRELFPPVVCYSKIVPVDEVVTLTLFYREDHLFARLLLNEAEKKQLDRLWDELHYISQDALTQVDAFHQLLEYASQDGDPKLFEPLRKPIYDAATAFRKQLQDSQAKHLEALYRLAAKAYRRPLTPVQQDELTTLYKKLRTQELSHEDALRLTLARVLVSPMFLYRGEKAGPDTKPVPVSDLELATRLSYFLSSSMPDDELTRLAVAGQLHEPATLKAQVKRLQQHAHARRMAKEFALQWLHINSFNTLNEKSEKHFPTFLALRGDMYEESILFFTDLLQRDRSILEIIDADYTYLNEALAKHYGIPNIVGPQMRRVEGIKKFGRGGIFAQATTLATQAGASRTSPILRGNWISEVILGEKLPKPPKGVPTLPEDEQSAGLTQRQLVEKHSADAKCAVCHQRIDPYGFSLEGYDAIGRKRDKDLGDRPLDTKVKAMDGTQFEGLDGLRSYLLTQRRDAFVRQFCKKLLGYALGRSVQLSDEPLLDEINTALKANNYRMGVALEMIVNSRQFRDIRGIKYVVEE